jgi:hypothetical protein
MRRTLIVGILAAALTSCALGGSSDQPGEEEEEGEYEVVGRIDHQLAADRFVILVQASPCDLATLAEATPLGGWDSVLGISSERMFGLEGLFNQDGEAYLCGFAVDADRRIIGYGAWPGNPITLAQAPDETVSVRADLTIAPVDPPLVLDSMRLRF